MKIMVFIAIIVLMLVSSTPKNNETQDVWKACVGSSRIESNQKSLIMLWSNLYNQC